MKKQYARLVFTLACFLVLVVSVEAQTTTSAPGPFDKIWSVAASQFAQAFQFANSIAQLPNGTIVAVGGDGGYQANACKGNFGGLWIIAVNPGGGKVFQKLDSTCATAAQSAGYVKATPDGGFIVSAQDSANLCLSCAMLVKFNGSGNIVFQEDLTTFSDWAFSAIPTSDGGYVAAGLGQLNSTQQNSGLVIKLSSTGAPEWDKTFAETTHSFPGAVANSGGGFSLNSIQPTADGGYIVSGVAGAKFGSSFANVLVVMKLDSTGGTQWAQAYYSSIWGSWGTGTSQYPIFQTSDGGYTVSGIVREIASPFAIQMFLLHLDSSGNVVWQKGYGPGASSGLNANGVAATQTSGGGYLLAGFADLFPTHPGEYDGWLVKTDGEGNIQWQNLYFGVEPRGSNDVQLLDVIETTDGGYAAAGNSYVGSLSFGGPGFYILKTDAQGNVGACGSKCSQPTNKAVQTVDLQAHVATFQVASPALTFTPTKMTRKTTSVTPTTLFPQSQN